MDSGEPIWVSGPNAKNLGLLAESIEGYDRNKLLNSLLANAYFHNWAPHEQASDTDRKQFSDLAAIEQLGAVYAGDSLHAVAPISDRSSAPVSAMAQCSRSEGVVLCAVCENKLAEFAVDSPSVFVGSSEVYQSFSIQCPSCGEHRSEHSLLVCDQLDSLSRMPKQPVLVSHWVQELVKNGPSEDAHKVLDAADTVCDSLSWEWLPEPAAWIGDRYDGERIQVEEYAQFFVEFINWATEDGLIRTIQIESDLYRSGSVDAVDFSLYTPDEADVMVLRDQIMPYTDSWRASSIEIAKAEGGGDYHVRLQLG